EPSPLEPEGPGPEPSSWPPTFWPRPCAEPPTCSAVDPCRGGAGGIGAAAAEPTVPGRSDARSRVAEARAPTRDRRRVGLVEEERMDAASHVRPFSRPDFSRR